MKLILAGILILAGMTMALGAGKGKAVGPERTEIIDLGVSILLPRGFYWQADAYNKEIDGYTNLEGSVLIVRNYDFPCPASDGAFDSAFSYYTHDCTSIATRKLTIDKYPAVEHMYRDQTRLVNLTAFGNEKKCILLGGFVPEAGGDSILAAIMKSFSGVTWDPHMHRNLADLGYSIKNRAPFTHHVIEGDNIVYTPEERTGDGSMPSFRVINYFPGKVQGRAERKTVACNRILDNKYFIVDKVDSIAETEVDSLAAVDVITAAVTRATHTPAVIFSRTIFDTAGNYYLMGITRKTDAARNVPIMEAMANSFERKPSLWTLVAQAADFNSSRRYAAALASANRAVALYPDSGDGYVERASAEDALGEYEAGLADIKTSLRRGYPVALTEYLSADLYEEAGNIPEAAALYEKFLRKKDTLGLFQAAKFFYAHSRYSEAEKALRIYTSTARWNDRFAHCWLYFTEWITQGRDSAAAHLKTYDDTTSQFSRGFPRALVPYLLGNPGEEELFAKARASDSLLSRAMDVTQIDLIGAYFYAGMNNLLAGETSKAKQYWNEFLAIADKNSPEYRHVMSHIPK